MHNFEIEIDKNLKELVYQYSGFGFSKSLLTSQELSYANLFKAIDLGPEYNRICKDLELDIEVAVEYTKKYVLHLIYQDSMNFIYPSKKALKELHGQEIKGQKIEDILNEIFFKTPPDLLNQLSYIEGFFTSKQIRQKLETEYDWNSIEDEKTLISKSVEKWKRNQKKTGSFYPLYIKYATRKSRLAKSLVKPYQKIKNFNQELLNKQVHFGQFIKALERVKYDTSQDIWSFEYNTHLFMLQKICSYEDIDKLDNMHFLVLASFICVEDIRLKLLLMDTLFKNHSWSHYKNKLPELFLLSYVIVPFLKEFIKDKLMEVIPESVLKATSKTDNKENEMKMISLKKQLYIYQTLKTENCYSGESLISEFGIDIKHRLTVTDGVKEAWKYIDKVSQKINEDPLNVFNKISKHLGQFESFLDLYNKDELTSTFKKWLEVGVFIANQDYIYTMMKTNQKNNDKELEFKSVSDLGFSGKTNDDLMKLSLHTEGKRHVNQKKLNKSIGRELAQLGIDINKLKEISRKYNCSVTIESNNIIYKTKQ